MTKYRILIADDQTLMREGLQTIIDLEPDMEVIDIAVNGQESYDKVSQQRPDVVLMDVQMPLMDGIESAKRIKKDFPETLILILTTFAEEEYIIDALAHGVDGYLLKDMKFDRLIDAIREAANGQMMLPGKIASKLASRIQKLSETAESEAKFRQLKTNKIDFSNREKQIISLLIQGITNKKIAQTLFITEGTVKNYISEIYSKIGVNNRGKAIVYLKEIMEKDDWNRVL
jgi:DNA-binding NarL/FixJ family response regulator